MWQTPRARAATLWKIFQGVLQQTPRERELHNVFPRWQRFHFGANPTRELHPRKNFSGGETGATPRARELHRELWKRCPHSRANPTSARAARIAEQVGVPRQTVADWIANFAEIDPEADSGIFRDFEPELYTGQTPRARAALFGGGKFSTTESNPHERESYSFQNSVVVVIMLVMHCLG